MIINGLQKMTLLDYPGKVACTVFFSRCNFRCPFCHNWELVESKSDFAMDTEDFFTWLETRKGLLDGVAITGGEPLCMHIEPFSDFCKRIHDMGFLVKLDTNGYEYEKLKYLLDNHLVDYVAMDIKNCLDKYPDTIGTELHMSNILFSIKNIMESGIDYEFRTTVMKELHWDNIFYIIGDMIKGAKAYYLQPFVDSDNVPNHTFTTPSKDDLERWKAIMEDYVDKVEIRGQD